MFLVAVNLMESKFLILKIVRGHNWTLNLPNLFNPTILIPFHSLNNRVGLEINLVLNIYPKIQVIAHFY